MVTIPQYVDLAPMLWFIAIGAMIAVPLGIIVGASRIEVAKWGVAFLAVLIVACLASADPWKAVRPDPWRGARVAAPIKKETPKAKAGCPCGCKCVGECLCEAGAPCDCGCGKSANFYWFPDLDDGGYFLRKGMHGDYVGYIRPGWNGDPVWVSYSDRHKEECPAGMPEVWPCTKNLFRYGTTWGAKGECSH